MAILPIAWDACALLNLAATGRAEEILESLACTSWVVSETLDREVLHLRPLPESLSQDLQAFSFEPQLATGQLSKVTLEPSELLSFVHFALRVDDGEARTIALAHHRSMRIATDDRPALRLMSQLSPPVPPLTTPEWLKQWVVQQAVGRLDAAEVLRRVELCARYRPGPRHPLFEWWEDTITHR